MRTLSKKRSKRDTGLAHGWFASAWALLPTSAIAQLNELSAYVSSAENFTSNCIVDVSGDNGGESCEDDTGTDDGVFVNDAGDFALGCIVDVSAGGADPCTEPVPDVSTPVLVLIAIGLCAMALRFFRELRLR